VSPVFCFDLCLIHDTRNIIILLFFYQILRLLNQEESSVKYYSYIPIFLIFSLFVGINCKVSPKNVSVVGTGYVGLIVGAGLADMGHNIVCADIDKDKITMLQNGKMPIYEPGLEKIVEKNVLQRRLYFTSNVPDAIRNSEIVIVAVGTPMGDNGDADLTALKAVVKTIAHNLNGYKVVCIKSTVPVGTNAFVKSFMEQEAGHADFDVVSNPEFLRAGSAIKDFFTCNPIVLGSDSEKALDVMADLYSHLIENGLDLIRTNFQTAEMIKYAWNSFSAIRIAYVNELSRFCCSCGSDIFTVVKGMSLSDKLLPSKKIKPGPGIGGSCLPKDTRAFVAMANKRGIDLCLVKAYMESNKKQKQFVVENLYKLLNDDVNGKVIGILGLSFKKNTDDIRMSPAIHVIQKLLKAGARVKAYDPRAMDNMKNIFPDIEYCDSCQWVVENVDAVVILTPWDEFKNIEFKRDYKSGKVPVIVDARNMFDPTVFKNNGIDYHNLGRC